MAKFTEIATVVKQESFGAGIFDLTLKTDKIAQEAKAGQFVSVYCNDPSKLLPRPISLGGIDKENNTIRLVYRVTGEGTGTEEFSKLVAGDTLRILGPLGNGFDPLPGKKAFVIGGGIGVPPMLQLTKDMRAADPDAQIQVIMGYRDDNTFLLDEFAAYADTYCSSDNGAVGTHGTVVDAIKANGLTADVIYACGPTPMLRALKAYAAEHDMECFVSMEERMACGIGACLACVCKTKNKTEHTNTNNARICADGPVFNAKEVEL